MHIDPSSIADDLIVMMIGAAVSWVGKMKKDITAAHCKLRKLEAKINERDRNEDTSRNRDEASDRDIRGKDDGSHC